MPEQSPLRHKPHWDLPARPRIPGDYAELQVTSNFSFLRGAIHPEELVYRAAATGCCAIAITDINSLAGVVRAHTAAKEVGLPLVVGCHLEMTTTAQVRISSPLPTDAAHNDPPLLSVLVYPTSRESYGRLCQLLTRGKRRAVKGQCHLSLPELLEQNAGLLAIAVAPPRPDDNFAAAAPWLKDTFNDDRLSLAVNRCYGPHDGPRFQWLAELARRHGLPLVATNDVHYHLPDRRSLQEVLTCIRLGCTRPQAGFALFANAERFIKGPSGMQRLFADCPQAIRRTRQIAERASTFSLDQLKYEYPAEVCPPGKTMWGYLTELTWAGAASRYPRGVPPDVRRRLEYELELIRDLNYAAYFLTVYDLVRFARSRGILCQGRGAAANSAVCYCLGVTAVDPTRIDLLLERFISRQRQEPPDIDIDFEHQRREEVIQYLYQKYGRDRVALTAEVITYRRRSAVRDIGKALGLSRDGVDRLAKSGDWWENGAVNMARTRELGLNPADPTLRELATLVEEILGFPRHLSQHVGGFVLTAGPLCQVVPIENAAMPGRTMMEWDKDDIDALGMLKVDVLALGMLTAIRRCLDLVNAWNQAQSGRGDLQFHRIPAEDPAVYDMLCRADSIGVFQVESRAQMTMLPRLKPRCYYDLVIEVAIVRPGPIVGDMVHPYLRRRNHEEPVRYPDPRIRKVLERTLGVPLFQEQAMALVMTAAGFTAGEADQLRRAMAAWKRKGELIRRFGEKIMAGMTANGYMPAYVQTVFNQIRGFSEYGFPESHAASFALLVYISAWLKCYHPAAFCAALLNSQPMGFYQPAQLVRDAQAHGVEVRPVDVNYSAWDCTLEDCLPVGPSIPCVPASACPSPPPSAPALRLGLRLVRNLPRTDAQTIVETVRHHGPFSTPLALWRAARGTRSASLVALAQADAFGSMGLSRQEALWTVQRLRDDPMPLFANTDSPESPVVLPPVPPPRMVIHDYAAVGLSLKAHPISFLRAELARRHITPAVQLADEKLFPHGKEVYVAGLVLVRQRPATAGGIIFMTIEDETGVTNLVVKPDIYAQYRRALRASAAILAGGRIERKNTVVHVVVRRAADLANLAPSAGGVSRSRDFH